MELFSLHVLKSMPLPLQPVKGAKVSQRRKMRKWGEKRARNRNKQCEKSKEVGQGGKVASSMGARGGRGRC